MADKRSKTSAANGKLGGRPKGFAALESERQRDMVAKKLKKEFEPIVTRAIKDAKEGDKYARTWLSEFAYGKPTQPITGADGSDLFPSDTDRAAAARALMDL